MESVNSTTLLHDGEVVIATANSRKSKKWKNQTVKWSWLAARLSDSKNTGETREMFLKASKDLQGEIKDIGGFVGGSLDGTTRTKKTIMDRYLLTLDADTPEKDFLDKCRALNCAMLIYSTHKHCPDSPRLRVVIPLSRSVEPDMEYEALGRKVGEKVGLNSLDDSTFEACRMMYWASHPSDVEPYCELIDKDFLDVDKYLDEYEDYLDPTEWAYSGRVKAREEKKGVKRKGTAVKNSRSNSLLEDPALKQGVVGDFCRAYTITEAIETFLADVYEPTDDPDRYTYIGATTSKGLVIFGDNYAYSHHSTDPAACGHSLNAFDLVRIHKFGYLDEEGEE